MEKEMNVEMRYLTPPESIATIPNSVRTKMANKDTNAEMRSLILPQSIAAIPNSVRPKFA